MVSKASDLPPPKMTQATQQVLRALLENPTHELYGLEICGAAGFPSGTIHPILARLEAAGWLDSRWEDIDPAEQGRPRRRYYKLSPDGAARAYNALARAEANRNQLRSRRPGSATGATA